MPRRAICWKCQKRPAEPDRRKLRPGSSPAYGRCRLCQVRYTCASCGGMNSSGILCGACSALCGKGGRDEAAAGPIREEKIDEYTQRAAQGLPLFSTSDERASA